MLKTFLNSKIHNIKVTETSVDYEGSIGIDALLMEMAGIMSGERVDIYDITNGERLSTYAISEERGSGRLRVLGAAAKRINPGDRLIIASYVQLNEIEWPVHKPKIVHVDECNHPV